MTRKSLLAIFGVTAVVVITLSVWSIVNINRDIDKKEVKNQVDENNVSSVTETVRPMEDDDKVSPVGVVTITPKEEIIRTDSDTIFVLKKHFIDDDKITEETLTIPAIFVGLTKDELFTYTRDYIKKPNLVDMELNIVDYIINEFSSDKIILTKVYESMIQDEYYYITITNNYITVYYDDQSTVKEVTGYSVDMLNEEIVELLKEGVIVYGEQGIIELLENYTS